MKPAPQPTRRTLRDLPFTELVATDPDLSHARHDYAGKSASARREAAQWAYDSSMAEHLLGDALRQSAAGTAPQLQFDPGVLALAIDPLFAPALLTVGSLEHQLGRVAAAMGLFLTLTSLSAEEPDLAEIIEKAAAQLRDDGDDDKAMELYRRAADKHPSVATYWSGLSYCLARRGDLTAALLAARQAVALAPRNPVLLNDLGWTLIEAGEYTEARRVLQKAVALAGPDFDLPRTNRLELEARCRRTPKRRIPTHENRHS